MGKNIKALYCNDISPKPRSTPDLRQILNQIVQINYSVNNK